MAKFKVGDTVVAKGITGPVMIVNTVYSDGDCACFWFAGKKKEVSRFHPDTLQAAPADAG